jgi:hypothetical protein
VKPSACENVTMKSRKKGGGEDPQPGTLSESNILPWSNIGQRRGLSVVLTNTFSLGFENVKVNVQNVLFYFIRCM